MNTLVIASVTVFTVDLFSTFMALDLFKIRLIEENDINVENKEDIAKKYNKIYSNEKLSNFIDEFWGDKRMIRTFPNIKVQDTKGQMVYLDSYLKDIQPYYLKIYEKKY